MSAFERMDLFIVAAKSDEARTGHAPSFLFHMLSDGLIDCILKIQPLNVRFLLCRVLHLCIGLIGVNQVNRMLDIGLVQSRSIRF